MLSLAPVLIGASSGPFPPLGVLNEPAASSALHEFVKPPIRIAPIYALHLANGTLPGCRVVQLRQPCVELGALSILGFALESANEEFVQLAVACSSLTCSCALRSPLRFVSCRLFSPFFASFHPLAPMRCHAPF